jgi:hypothetical protein
MFQPREIVYGHVKNIHPPKNKYIVTIYCDDNLSIVACFTTSLCRAGAPEQDVRHGATYREKDCVSYVFEAGVEIGNSPECGAGFSFPLRTTIAFDYGVREGQLEQFLAEFDSPKVVVG